MTPTSPNAPPLRVLYGSEMGNGEYVARDLISALEDRGIAAQLHELDDLPIEDLSAGGVALIVVSTYGEGEMPYGAEDFWDRIDAEDARELPLLQYAVLALGDRSYTYFCEAGRLIDDRLSSLGATRLAERVDCGANYRNDAAQWISARVDQLSDGAHGRASAAVPAAAVPAAPTPPSAVPAVADGAPPSPEQSEWTGERPFAATVRSSRTLTTGPSGDEVRHYEIDLAGSGIDYLPGDSLAVIPVNDPAAVEEFLDAAGTPGWMQYHGQSLRFLAQERWELRFPSLPLLERVAAKAPGSELGTALGTGRRDAVTAWIETHSVPETLWQLRAPLTVAELGAVMSPIRYRAYSIASSPRSHPDAAHLTVATRRHSAGIALPGGVASTYLSDLIGAGDTVRVFPLPNRSFRLPADPGAPIVAVGPGVGVAPFRAFLTDRAHSRAPGGAWLFTGTRHRREGLPYLEDWERLLADGTLSRLDIAYSRDQHRRVYVQELMREHGAELIRWLQDGAYFYVCGDARHMAAGVEAALHETAVAVLGDTGGKALLDRLHQEKRYLRDVY